VSAGHENVRPADGRTAGGGCSTVDGVGPAAVPRASVACPTSMAMLGSARYFACRTRSIAAGRCRPRDVSSHCSQTTPRRRSSVQIIRYESPEKAGDAGANAPVTTGVRSPTTAQQGYITYTPPARASHQGHRQLPVHGQRATTLRHPRPRGSMLCPPRRAPCNRDR
jgi:hypothetical protein